MVAMHVLVLSLPKPAVLPESPAALTRIVRGGRAREERLAWRRAEATAGVPFRVPQFGDALDDEELLQALRTHRYVRIEPFSRRLVGRATIDWLGGAAQSCACEYLELAEQLLAAERYAPRGRGHVEEVLARHFAPAPLLARATELLRDEPPPESVDPRIAALALAHLPTVHALFIRSVRALLRLRAAATGAAWERCPEWKMLPRLPQDRS